ncbi:MAG: polysaccharide biosynthesis protein [Oscillospiraceae bacterium]|nr:polysaccharide biosynthesis protein [Oscillospiraceae bacterium]
MPSHANHNPPRQGFLHGAVVLAVGAMLAKIVGALFKIPLTRLIGTEGAGHFNAAYNIYIVLLNVSSTGLPLAVSRLISEADALKRTEQIRTIRRVSLSLFLLIGGICSCGMFFGAELLAGWIRDPEAVYAIRILSPAVLFVCVSSSFRGYFQGQQCMTQTAVAQVLEALCKLLIGLAAVIVVRSLGWNIPRTAGAAIAGVTFGAGLGCAYFIFEYRKSPQIADMGHNPVSAADTALKILRLAVPITIGATGLQIINAIGSGIILGRLQDTLGYDLSHASSLYGIYAMAQTLYLLPSALIQPLTVSMIPAVTESLTLDHRADARKKEESALRLTGILALPAGAGLSVLSAPIQRLLYGYDDATILVAEPTLMILGIASVGYCLILVTNAILQAHGKAAYAVCATVAGGVANLLVTSVLVSNPEIHILGAALGTVVYCVVALGCNMLFIRVLIGDPPHVLVQLVKPAAASVVMSLVAGAVFAWMNSTAAAIAAAVVVYMLLVMMLKMLTREDCLTLPKGQLIAKLLRMN